MRRKDKIIIAFALAIMVLSCKQKSALSFNQAIIAKEKEITPAIEAAEASVGAYYKAGKFDSVAAIGERMERLVQKTIDEIKVIKAPDRKEAEEFKIAFLEAFAYGKDIYTVYKKIGKATTAEDRQKQLLELDQVMKNKEEAVKDMQAAQKRFAAANGFKLQ